MSVSLVCLYFVSLCSFSFFFNDTATTEIYTLSLHDALPICQDDLVHLEQRAGHVDRLLLHDVEAGGGDPAFLERLDERGRSEEHTSELQSRLHLVCRLLLEKKKKNSNYRRSQLNREMPVVAL